MYSMTVEPEVWISIPQAWDLQVETSPPCTIGIAEDLSRSVQSKYVPGMGWKTTT